MVSAPDHQRGLNCGKRGNTKKGCPSRELRQEKIRAGGHNGTLEVFVDGLKNPSRSAAAESSSLATAVWKYVVECRGVVSSES